jgi:sigma-B regulation protein RsbU (phosphoserine phosphatase)
VRLEAGGLPLGLFARASYAQGEVRVEPGDILVLYSDGVTEAPDAAGEEFGEERLTEVIRRNRAAPAGELASAIRSAVTEWSSADSRSDDTTVLVFRAG